MLATNEYSLARGLSKQKCCKFILVENQITFTNEQYLRSTAVAEKR